MGPWEEVCQSTDDSFPGFDRETEIFNLLQWSRE